MIDDRSGQIYSLESFDVGWLICDDLGTETSDFIALDKRQERVAVIHCKANSPSPTKPAPKKPKAEGSTSATDLQEVVAQATKNLSLLDIAGFTPDRPQKWNKRWAKNKKLWRVRHWPSRGGRPDAAQFMVALKSALRKSDVRRELWIVMGNSISASAVRTAVRTSTAPEYHEVQLLYLLNSLNAHTAHFGGRLRVFTAP